MSDKVQKGVDKALQSDDVQAKVEESNALAQRMLDDPDLPESMKGHLRRILEVGERLAK